MAILKRRAATIAATPVVAAYAQDERPYPHNDPSNRWSPELGVTHPTHGQVEVLTGARSTRPNPTRPPAEHYSGDVRREVHLRHLTQEVVDPGLDPVLVPNMRALNTAVIMPGPPVRPTAVTNPHTYNFMRPFDQEFAHSLNGYHFSMADHKRDYPIYGMAPAISRRNTLRESPPPYDTLIYDKAENPASEANPAAVYASPGIPPRATRRLT